MKRVLLREFTVTPATRDADGHIVAWARVAKDAVAAYLEQIERHPASTVVLTLTVQ